MTIKLMTRADDFGSSQASNQAIYEALAQKNYLKNVSCMAVGPLIEAGARSLVELQKNDVSIGMHGTLTSEWSYLKWFPISQQKEIPSLITANQTFPEAFKADRPIDFDEVILEFEAQLDFLTKLGLNISYLDTHMLPEYFYPELIPLLKAWTQKKGLIYHMDWYEMGTSLGPHSFHTVEEGFNQWTDWISKLKGVYQLALMHPMTPGREGLSFTNEKIAVGAVGNFRSKEYDLLLSGKLEAWCDQQGIQRISYEYAETHLKKAGNRDGYQEN